ncbi:MAG TPA: alpha-L-arabinofuranosidase C-terminal domain-containing protein [bacterium]|nr:alpha-L-arabinofuranosidase C-terminal domain-containing protein [bacterium]HPP29562.1 alpha-L-arabinofuranosidase C-terminal domain-containing protein [bacterium]
MKKTVLNIHTGFQIGKVDERIFGGFLEHLGRAVYEGVYDPKSINADEDGFRKDVMSTLKRLNMTVMRYPGGNFASGYHWLDGVGPKDKRPVVRDLAWQTLEPNQFGTDEFIKLCKKMEWSPMLTVNLGTGSPEEAGNWLEYCNLPAGTRYADMRAANGNKEPYNVKLWCLGNEMDGLWQLGHLPARDYVIKAQQAAKIMKDVDSTIELIVCGSCGISMPTYMEWDREVLEYIWEFADYISLHRYVGNYNNDTSDFLAVTNSIDKQIEEMDSGCRFVQAKKRSKKRVYLCFDEWNVWYKNHESNGKGQFAPHLLEEIYNLEDALVVAGFLNSFIRHSDMLKIANLAQIVNVIAPVITKGDDLLIQSIFYPFEMVSKRRKGVSLQLHIEGPFYESPSYGSVNYIDASAILGDGKLHIFAVNRGITEKAEVLINPADIDILSLEGAEIITGNDTKAANSFEKPDVIVSREFKEVKVSDGKAICQLPPLSFVAMTFKAG